MIVEMDLVPWNASPWQVPEALATFSGPEDYLDPGADGAQRAITRLQYLAARVCDA